MGEISRRRAVAVLVVLAVAAFSYVTTEVLPVGLLTVMADDLGRSRSQIGLLVTGYAVVVVLASVPLTRLTGRVPRRQLLAGTLAVSAASTVVAAAAPSYPVLFGTRLVTALTQALFWSVVGPTVAGLFPPEVRGWTQARLAIGASLAPVLGVPAGTWLGQQAGWRTAFAVLAVILVGTGAAVAVLVPTFPPEHGGATRGTAPDVRRFAILMVVTPVGVAGFITAFTYITPFLLDVSGFAAGALGPLLFVSGGAGIVGTLLVGRVLDQHPWAAMVVPLAMITAGLAGLYALGQAKPLAVAMVALSGLAFGALPPALGSRGLQVAPGSTDLASAGVSSAFNVGIAVGSALGGLLITGAGVRSVALAGALLALVALAVVLTEPRLARRTSRGAIACGASLHGAVIRG